MYRSLCKPRPAVGFTQKMSNAAVERTHLLSFTQCACPPQNTPKALIGESSSHVVQAVGCVTSLAAPGQG